MSEAEVTHDVRLVVVPRYAFGNPVYSEIGTLSVSPDYSPAELDLTMADLLEKAARVLREHASASGGEQHA